MSFRSVAVDLEFIKCRGHPYMRSIAFVPFTRAAAASPATTTTTDHTLQQYQTHFASPTTVLALTPETVMQQAELLPCGHVLLDFIERTKLAAPALAAIKEKHRYEAETQLAAYRALRRDMRAALKDTARQPRGGDMGERAPEDDTGAARLALSPAEEALNRELQMRCGIAKYFERLDPYSIPNLRLVEGREALRALYTAPADSDALRQASASLSRLRRYGKGKGPQKALCFLFRYYPSFVQEVLRASFGTAEDWLRWLEEAARLTEGEMMAVAAHHRQLAADSGCVYTEFDTLEALGGGTRRAWSAYQPHRHSRVKFYCYGTVDNSVLYRTLLLDDEQQAGAGEKDGARGQPPPPRHRFSPRGAAAGRGGGRMPPSAFGARAPALVPPHEARLVDVTHHPVFTASGFRKGKMVPSLSTALEKTVRRDATAGALLRCPRAHDPLWDAQALACVGAAAGLA